MKYVQIFVVLVILSQMNAFHMPAKLCAPLKNIGLKVASGVIDCAGKSPMARKAMRAAVKAGKKIPSKKDMAQKMVMAIAGKVGCKRRLFGVKKFIHHAAAHIKKVGTAALAKAKDMACKKFSGMCPKACDAGVAKVVPIMKNYKIPTKCFSKVAKDTCHESCHQICKH
jgi:hypothetical protein